MCSRVWLSVLPAGRATLIAPVGLAEPNPEGHLTPAIFVAAVEHLYVSFR